MKTLGKINMYLWLLLAAMPTWAAPWDTASDGILDAMNGGVMRTIAIIVVMFIGIGILGGRVALETGVKVIAGIVVIFAAAAIVDLIIGWST